MSFYWIFVFISFVPGLYTETFCTKVSTTTKTNTSCLIAADMVVNRNQTLIIIMESSKKNVSGKVLNSIPEVRDPTTAAFYPLSADAIKAIDAIEYITDHLKKEEEFKTLRDDWKYVAMIVDRLLLYMFFGITLGGTLGILLSAPNVFEDVDHARQLQKLIEIYKAGTSNA